MSCYELIYTYPRIPIECRVFLQVLRDYQNIHYTCSLIANIADTESSL